MRFDGGAEAFVKLFGRPFFINHGLFRVESLAVEGVLGIAVLRRTDESFIFENIHSVVSGRLSVVFVHFNPRGFRNAPRKNTCGSEKPISSGASKIPEKNGFYTFVTI